MANRTDKEAAAVHGTNPQVRKRGRSGPPMPPAPLTLEADARWGATALDGAPLR